MEPCHTISPEPATRGESSATAAAESPRRLPRVEAPARERPIPCIVARMLTPFAKDVWVEAREGKFFGVECGTRMTVVRLGHGGLFVHSPVGLDAATRRAVDALGEVQAVVAPSLFHHLHVGAWMRAYPKAVFGACPGLEWKRPDLAFSCVLADEPLDVWSNDLQQVYFSSRRENEVVFFHAASRTMITCDALLNLAQHPAAGTRLVARMMGNTAPGAGWPERLMIRDRQVARRQADRILGWDIDKIVLAHGTLVLGDGREVVRRAYAWL